MTKRLKLKTKTLLVQHFNDICRECSAMKKGIQSLTGEARVFQKGVLRQKEILLVALKSNNLLVKDEYFITNTKEISLKGINLGVTDYFSSILNEINFLEYRYNCLNKNDRHISSKMEQCEKDSIKSIRAEKKCLVQKIDALKELHNILSMLVYTVEY